MSFPKMDVIETQRLLLRPWKEEDLDPYFQLNQDPKVLEFLPGPLSHNQVAEFIKKMNAQLEKKRYTLWATELKETQEFIGFIGLNEVDFEAHFTPAVEIGWRLDSRYWGKGYSTEGANAALEYGFNKLGLSEIVAFTVLENKRSIRVMEKMGMIRDFEGDFRHPKLALEHRLSQHILYRTLSVSYLKLVY